MKKLAIAFVVIFTTLSCTNDSKKRRGIDYTIIKTELSLNEEQTKKFDEIVAKYKKIAEESRAASGDSKPDRVEMFKKMEERTIQQTNEMASFLNEEQLQKYTEFVAKNTRKRPRYSDELLTKLKTELNLSEQQAKVLEASNNAFEKAFQDAHDIYHGNSDLAKEYWVKFDTERKNAIQSFLSEEQFTQFLELVKDENYKGRE